MTSVPVIWCDNVGVASLAANRVYHARIKNIEIDVYFIPDMVLSKEVEIIYIPTYDQTGDVLTKGYLLEDFSL